MLLPLPTQKVNFTIKSAASRQENVDCVVLGVTDGQTLTPLGATIDADHAHYLSQTLAMSPLPHTVGASRLALVPKAEGHTRVLLLSLGKAGEFNVANLRKAHAAAVKALDDLELGSILSDLLPQTTHLDVAEAMEQATFATIDAFYRFDACLSASKKPESPIQSWSLWVHDHASLAAAEQGFKAGLALAEGVAITKNLANMPANICTPTYLADQAVAIAKQGQAQVEVLDEHAIEELKMGSFLSVAKGSDQAPRFIVLKHEGGAKGAQPVVLVGKGITFDSGGISIKPAEGMDEMKYDMCGAATVLGVFAAAVQLALPINLVVLVAACENMPSGRANKPGDVVTAMNGMTIEILNTDAEGRLILADALTYAERFNPACVIDVATLTGACVVALGHHATGLYSNNDALLSQLQQAGEASGDRAWPMPLWDEYQKQIDGVFGDLLNTGGRMGGSVTAACFLARFAANYQWAHLDVAGTAWKSGAQKGATARPVPLLLEFLKRHAAKV